jgi:hypothetical protein
MFGRALEQLEEAIDKVAASEARIDVARMCRIAERVEFLKLRALAQLAESGEWAADGYLSAQSWLCARTGTPQPLTLARRLTQLPATAAALERGAITRHHSAAIADACTPERVAAIAEVEAELVELAQRVRPRELRGIVRRLADALDGDGGAACDEARHAQRRLHVSETLHGMGVLDGALDPEGTEIVQTALAAEMARGGGGASDVRSRPQRRADALVDICRRALNEGAVGGARRARPHVTVVVDLAELEGRAPAVTEAIRCDAVHTGRVSRAVLERLSCDCDVSRVITSGRSEVLDVGRATRTIPPAIWSAVVARDQHCVAPGCDRPPGLCDVHHVQHWARGGRTSLDNLQLLCWQHHRNVHNARAPAKYAM